jgi:hypothetical protein
MGPARRHSRRSSPCRKCGKDGLPDGDENPADDCAREAAGTSDRSPRCRDGAATSSAHRTSRAGADAIGVPGETTIGQIPRYSRRTSSDNSGQGVVPSMHSSSADHIFRKSLWTTERNHNALRDQRWTSRRFLIPPLPPHRHRDTAASATPLPRSRKPHRHSSQSTAVDVVTWQPTTSTKSMDWELQDLRAGNRAVRDGMPDAGCGCRMPDMPDGTGSPDADAGCPDARMPRCRTPDAGCGCRIRMPGSRMADAGCQTPRP